MSACSRVARPSADRERLWAKGRRAVVVVIAGGLLRALARLLCWCGRLRVFFFFSIFYFLAPLSLSRGAPPCRRVSAFSILYLNQPLMSRLSGRASDMGGSGGWGMAGGRGGVLAAEGRVRATDGGVKK